MQVKDVMTTAPVTVPAQGSVWEAIQLMLARKVSGLPVLDAEGALVGVLSEGDLLRRVELGTMRPDGGWLRSLFLPGGLAEGYKAAHARRVADVMSVDPVTISPAATLEQAVSLMETHRCKRLPVMEGDRLVGIISRSDFLRVLAPMMAPTYEEPATGDAEIGRLILEELHRQSWAASSAVSVRVHQGHVELTGTVLSDAQRDAVRVLAENVNGVRGVTDHMVWADPMLQYGM